MKRLLLILLTTLLLVLGFTLSGCSKTAPIVFDSIVRINTDESGSRTLTATIEKSTLKAIFGNQSTSFQSFIAANCPDELLSWDYVEKASSYVFTFTLDFHSLDDYQSAVEKLTEVPNAVTVSRPQVGVKTGFTLSESTDAAALFSWLRKALENRSRMNSAKLASLFTNGSNEFYYAGRYYEQNSGGLYAYIENLLDAESIDILTRTSVDGFWSRTVRIRFPASILDNAPNVKNYLTTMLPEGVEESWEENTIWVLNFPDSTVTDLAKLMSGVFQSQSGTSLQETITTASSMEFVHVVSEPLSVAFYAPSAGQTTVRYYIQMPDRATLYVNDAEGTEQPAVSLNEDYSGYFCLYDKTVSEDLLTTKVVYSYQPLEILTNTEIVSTEDIRRQVKLEMGKSIPQAHRRLMMNELKSTLSHGATLKEQLSDDGLFSIYYYVSGTEKETTDSLLSIFQTKAALNYQADHKITFDKELPGSVSDWLDFSVFLPNPGQTIITSRLTLPYGQTFADGNRTATAVFTSGTASIISNTSRSNLLRYLYFVLIGLAVCFLLYWLVTGPVKKQLQARSLNKTRHPKTAHNKKTPARRSDRRN